MLVLSRRKNESIYIGPDVDVVVVEIRGDKVRLGVLHPRDVGVHRREVWEAIHGSDVIRQDEPNELRDRKTQLLTSIRERMRGISTAQELDDLESLIGRKG